MVMTVVRRDVQWAKAARSKEFLARTLKRIKLGASSTHRLVNLRASSITPPGSKPILSQPSFRPEDIIVKTRDGIALSAEEARFLVDGVLTGENISEAQIGAWIVAASIMGVPETVDVCLREIKGSSAPAHRVIKEYFNGATLKNDGNDDIGSIVLKTIQKEEPLTRDEIFTFIRAVVDRTASDFQVGGWLMAVRLKGLSDLETAYLTEAMWKTGGSIDFSGIEGPRADKHAAGGSCDITSFIIAPLLACFGIKVPMMSGRALAHTGGTLDKLESIPGFNVKLSEEEVRCMLSDSGLAIFSQMETMAPADRILYAFRDVTGTVACTPLIAASIMSKKLAEGAEYLALMGTYGNGAFSKDPDEARELARLMIAAGVNAGRKMVSFLVDMNEPLAPFVGPALEMKLAIRVLKGQIEGNERLVRLSIQIAAKLLVMAGIYSPKDIIQAQLDLVEHLYNGEAIEKFKQMVIAQGGDPNAIGAANDLTDSPIFPQGTHRIEIRAKSSGFVQAIRADEIGNAVNSLGAGRKLPGEPIDHGVGVANIKLIGEAVKEGDVLAVVYANDMAQIDQITVRIANAFSIGAERIEPPKLVFEVIETAA
ncbi:MAG: thymidine phosphorylase [Candidatus Margulisiibacteriota bacterium]